MVADLIKNFIKSKMISKLFSIRRLTVLLIYVTSVYTIILIFSGPNGLLDISSKLIHKVFNPTIKLAREYSEIIKEIENIPITDLDDNQARKQKFDTEKIQI